jgi:glycosyltransferase involved in cell wall biosynthesis
LYNNYMKLLFISEVYTPWQGGAIVAIRNLMRQLVEDGNKVALITGEKRKQWRLWGTRTEFDQECQATVYRIPAVPYPFNSMSTMTIPDFAGIRKIILHEKPDCIHIFSPIGIAEKIALSYAKRHQIPVIVTNHIMPENFTYNVTLPQTLQKLADNLIYKDLIRFCNQAQIVTAPTKTAINLLRSHGLQTHSEVVTNGVDAEFFHPGMPDQDSLSRFNLGKNNVYILYIGRLDGEKRVDLLIKAMPFIVKRVPHAKLLIAGKGIKRDDLRGLVSNLQLKEVIKFLGKVSEEEKLALLQTAKVFAIASPTELQCISGLEALSCGLPVVVADQMALKELVNNEKNGRIFHYPEVHELAARICSVLEDAKLQETYGKNGREWILQHHQLAHALRLFEKNYHQVVGSTILLPFVNTND